ncbi:MAG: methylenetetrahydrofolate reductase C-terminal domain-containing protein [bacterium]
MSKLKEKIAEKKEFIVTFESVPGRGYGGGNVEEAIEFGEKIISSKLPVHAISITDNPGGNPAISPDVLARELHSIGIEALVHFACNNSNRNMIESRAYALARSGIENLLVITGDYPVGGYNGMAKPIFDLDSVQTIRYLKDMNKGLEIPGRKKGTFDKLSETNFFVGCAVSPFKKTEAELMTQFFKLEKKILAGADFIIPQLGYDVRKFAEIVKYMKYRNINTPIMGNVYVLNRPVARFMNKGHIHGCIVTDELVRKIEEEANAPDKGKDASLKRAAQLMAIFRGLKFNGVHIGGFGLKFEDLEYIIKQAEEMENNWREYIPNFRYNQEDEYYCFSEEGNALAAPPSPKSQSLNFQVSKFCHHFVFTKEAPAYKTVKCIYELLEKWKFAGDICHFFERQIKRLLFDCQECGDCAIFDLAYLCPMSKCAKFQRNGPCGGSKNGMCEANDTKRCVWTLAYDRFSSTDNLDYLRREYIPPVDCSLSKTSSWANFFMGRDHTGKK